jgi:hypothetical protein
MVMSTTGLGPENYCAGEGQQQLQTTDLYSRQRECYMRTMTAKVRLNKIAGHGFKGLGAKTN